MNMSFTILKKDSTTQARLGLLRTPHGTVQTPAYVMVATHAQIKTLKPSDIKKTKTQIVIANTYHLWEKTTDENKELRKKNKGRQTFILKRLGTRLPTMTDSGGFQVFSFGAAKEHGVGKVLKRSAQSKVQSQTSKVAITEKGVSFVMDGKKKFLSPELSIKLQEQIGADIIFAFDECTSPLHPFAYNKNAMLRTHRWLKRCVAAHRRTDQLLYGIIQGGRFASLRKASAKFVGSLPVGGIGIGGSFGKDEMVKTLRDITPYLPEDKPRHLLGIGSLEDIFNAIESGMDTFDCVIPTREARHGKIYANPRPYNIGRAEFANSKSRLDPGCKCPACSQGITRGKLRALFKAKDFKAGRYATLHNLWFFNTLLEKIRKAISHGTFKKIKKQYLKNLGNLTVN